MQEHIFGHKEMRGKQLRVYSPLTPTLSRPGAECSKAVGQIVRKQKTSGSQLMAYTGQHTGHVQDSNSCQRSR